jgi:hypothetical protein
MADSDQAKLLAADLARKVGRPKGELRGRYFLSGGKLQLRQIRYLTRRTQ